MSGIYVGTSEIKNIYVGTTPVKEVYVGTTKVRPKENPLCFTAGTANSTVQLNKTGNPTAVTLETSRDGSTWTTYTFGSTITLSRIGDKVYFRNTSTTTTGFSLNNSNFYQFVMRGIIAGSGDVNYLLNKRSTKTVSSYCYDMLFYNCNVLTTPPELPATTLANNCYQYMFGGCTSLDTLPKLPATTLPNYCYYYMFVSCTNIRISTYMSGAYRTEYRVPITGTGTEGTESVRTMFSSTGGAYYGNISINTTYYTSNTVV